MFSRKSHVIDLSIYAARVTVGHEHKTETR